MPTTEASSIPYELTAPARRTAGCLVDLCSGFSYFPVDPDSSKRYADLTMLGGILSSGVGGPVSKFISTTSKSPGLQARIEKFAVTPAPAPAVVPDPVPEPMDHDAAPEDLVIDAEEEAPPVRTKVIRKSAAAAVKSKEFSTRQELDDDDEDEEDDDFDGHESDDASDADGSDSDSESGDDDDSDDDDDDPLPVIKKKKEKEPAPDASTDKKKKKEIAASVDSGSSSKPRKDKERLSDLAKTDRKPRNYHEEFLEHRRKTLGEDYDSDEAAQEADAESLNSDDDEDEDDDCESDDSCVVLDDESRIARATDWCRVAAPIVRAPAKKSDGPAISADHNRQVYEALMSRLQARGFNVTAALPDIDPVCFERTKLEKPAVEDDNGDDDAEGSADAEDDDDEMSGDPEQTPVHQLVPAVIARVEQFEPDLPELLAQLSRDIFSKCRMAYISSQPPAVDFAVVLASTWEQGSPFYARCAQLIHALLARSKSSTMLPLLECFSTAFAKTGRYEFLAERQFVDELHMRSKVPCLCSRCGEAVPARHEPDTPAAPFHIVYTLMQPKTVQLERGAIRVSAHSAVPHRSTLKNVAITFFLCDGCSSVIDYMNCLLTAPYELISLALVWLRLHHDQVVGSTVPAQQQLDAFNNWPNRVSRCNAIMASYKMMRLPMLR